MCQTLSKNKNCSIFRKNAKKRKQCFGDMTFTNRQRLYLLISEKQMGLLLEKSILILLKKITRQPVFVCCFLECADGFLSNQIVVIKEISSLLRRKQPPKVSLQNKSFLQMQLFYNARKKLLKITMKVFISVKLHTSYLQLYKK